MSNAAVARGEVARVMDRIGVESGTTSRTGLQSNVGIDEDRIATLQGIEAVMMSGLTSFDDLRSGLKRILTRKLAVQAAAAMIALAFLSRIEAYQVDSQTPSKGEKARSAARRLIPFQGHLTSPTKNDPKHFTVVPDDQYTLYFTLYTAPVGGDSKIWGPERHEKVVVVGGLINALIGSVEGGLERIKPAYISGPLYVGVTIDADGNPTTPDLELVPRQVLLPALYAHEAGHSAAADVAERFGGHSWSEIEALKDRIQMNTPAGTIVAFYGSKVPPGWLLCDGTRYPLKPEYREIGEILGISNGSGGPSIQVPDLRGRVAVGSGHGDNLTNRVPRETLGEEGHVLTTSEMPRHHHSGTTSLGNAAFHRFMHNTGGKGTGGNHDTGYGDGHLTDFTDTNYMMRNHTHDFITSDERSGSKFNNMQPSLVVNMIIKY